MATMSPLRRRMIEDMTIRNLSPATQQSYLHAVSKFSRHFGRSPDRLGLEEVHAFQVHLVATGISWPSLNQIVCALRFFYGVTLGQATIPERIAYAREPQKLPVVLSADEVVRFLEAISGLKSRIALTTVYAAGLRVSEAVMLKIADIDSSRMVIRVEQGKGGKDRYVMLSPQLLRILRGYWRLARPKRWLFPGRDRPADDRRPARLPSALAAGFQAATVHTLRTASPLSAGERTDVRISRYARVATKTSSGNDAEPARPAPGGGRAVRLSRRHGSRPGGGGHLPPPRRGVSADPWRPSRLCRAARHGRDHSMPDRGAGRPCRAVRRLWDDPYRLQLLSYGQIQ